MTGKDGQGWRRGVIPLLCLLMAGAIVISLGIGAYPVPVGRVARILLAFLGGDIPGLPRDWNDAEAITVQVIRLPRILLVCLAGAGLGLAGASLQGMMRNPLVGPDLVGISAGAACGGLLAIWAGATSACIVISAFAGGLGALVLAWGLSRLGRAGGVLPLILAGIVVAAFFSAVNGLIQYMADPEDKLPGMIYWMIGSFAGANMAKLATAAPPILVSLALLLLLRWRINLLSLGDLDAASLGINVGRLRWLIIALVAMIVAAQVSVSGIVGWVGLIVPHFARMMVGPDHRRLLPASALIGGTFLLVMDDLARTVTTQELPIGILTAVVGTPVFAFLFWRLQARGWNRE